MLTTAQYSRATLSRQRLRFSDRKITTFSLILKIFSDIFFLHIPFVQNKFIPCGCRLFARVEPQGINFTCISYSLYMACQELSYFQALAYFQLGFRIDAVELAQAAHCHVVARCDCTECIALLDLVGGCARRFAA